MTDKTQLQSNDDNIQTNHSQEDRQDIFEQRFQELMGGFGELCEKHGIKSAIAIAAHPPDTDLDENDQLTQPMVFFRGEIIESMSLAAGVLREFKTQLSNSLDTNPR